MKVYMNRSPWDFGASTDRKIQLKFKTLSAQYRDLYFYYPRSLFCAVQPVIQHLYHAIMNRLFHRKNKPGFRIVMKPIVSKSEFEKQHFDLVYSQGVVPVYGKNIPFLCDLYFIDPSNEKAHVTKDDLSVWQSLVEDMGKIAEKCCIINLRSDYSLRLVSEYFPQYAYKFVNLPFLLPNLKPVSPRLVIQKHTNVDVFRIAFVGAQAIRKGLPLLLQALKKLFVDRHICNVELHIISGCTDGKISFPTTLPIIYHGSKDYQYTMNLLKESHIYVMPSYIESFGLTYVEAIANGCVTVARDFEPQREIVNYGEAGLLVKLDADDIADKLQWIIQLDEKERIKLALKGLDYFRSKYEYSVVAERWYTVIKECIDLNN